MGNNSSQEASSNSETEFKSSLRRASRKSITSAHTPALEKLFQKLELTAENDNGHPGELTRPTFEDVFHGPLKLFGHLLFRQMVSGSHHGNDKLKERITCEQFVKAGKEVLTLFEEQAQHKYYFKLFSGGKDSLTNNDALTMVNIAYALTLSSSMIPYTKSAADDRLFESVVRSMFDMKQELSYQETEKWMAQHCPHLFCGVHNWVYTILTGSKMPTEMEAAPVPQLEKFTEGNHCMTMGTLWLLSASLPYLYTHEKETEAAATSTNPLLTSYNFLMKLARLSRCQSWTTLYDSDQHGLSMNRFSHHVSSYVDPTVMLMSFEGRNLYCCAKDVPWREGSGRSGNDKTMLLQLTPVFRVVQAGGPLVTWNISDRNIPQGIQFGKDGKSIVLYIPKEFDKIRHYGVDCELHRVEMWGCGGQEALKQQTQQKQWERKEVEKHRSRKLHMDVNWEENPDKQILSWGGIETNHQYSRSGGI